MKGQCVDDPIKYTPILRCLTDVGFHFVCCENHWLIKKLVWLDKVEQRQVGKTKLMLEKPCCPPETEAEILPGKPQPCGNTQINGDGLN